VIESFDANMEAISTDSKYSSTATRPTPRQGLHDVHRHSVLAGAGGFHSGYPVIAVVK